MSEKDIRVYGLSPEQILEMREFWLKHHRVLPCGPLTFATIRKECVSMKHLLVGKGGFRRMYLGFNRAGHLVTDCKESVGCMAWEHESEIKDWKIEKYEGER
jgi:hypothetical protein